ncbi:hypothetical protein CON65_11420 [Bacillus pseudomycoides]|uniref:DUF4352 domain-containing protein n=1 Tax=Bacillus pseudomycoides TaxID=64104 RepID=A0AA91VCI5_9BACI|nr:MULTISPECIES: DUF4352 domain-containing protein [Bacillus]PEB47529.1 hypothetical protein COO03_25675 [Bacillus sp. AFS098217]PED82552.1 hypothetical protein CON65_11420 [Bacillus pseudomycoides]PEU11553.1 hypothetical protein CN525_22180 [Bacillus sp. AFS014408]PEU17253.1 hypothetical protein CN524_02560 [Bacillus sp. AFS019443]PFW60749.1 hypothetical protein COL20_20940 [Bacillus sp. AFS075034]
MKKFFKFGCLGIIALVVIGIVVAVAGGGDSEETKTEKAKTYKVNEVVKAKKVDVTVTKVEEKASVGPGIVKKDASNGGTIVAVQYNMKNTSDKPVNSFSLPTIQLVDEKGTKYDADVEASASYATETNIDNSKVLSDLNPDIQVTGTKAFEVSKEKYGAGKWYLLIDGDYKVEIK